MKRKDSIELESENMQYPYLYHERAVSKKFHLSIFYSIVSIGFFAALAWQMSESISNGNVTISPAVHSLGLGTIFLLLLIGMLVMLRAIFRMQHSIYGITGEFVSYRNGFRSDREVRVPISDISSVDVDVDFDGHEEGFGEVTLRRLDGGQVRLLAVRDPERFRDTIAEIMGKRAA
jgi:hypothetical protein